MNKWTKRWLNEAKHFSKWSKDPSTQVGSICVGEEGQILSHGYNGIPRGLKDDPEILNVREEKYKYMVHAEQNCVYNACLNGVSLKNSVVYVYGMPICHECAKGLIQVGVSKVIAQFDPANYERWKWSADLATEFFKKKEIPYIKYNLDFSEFLG